MSILKRVKSIFENNNISESEAVSLLNSVNSLNHWNFKDFNISKSEQGLFILRGEFKPEIFKTISNENKIFLEQISGKNVFTSDNQSIICFNLYHKLPLTLVNFKCSDRSHIIFMWCEKTINKKDNKHLTNYVYSFYMMNAYHKPTIREKKDKFDFANRLLVDDKKMNLFLTITQTQK